jgi:hypothetical protein
MPGVSGVSLKIAVSPAPGIEPELQLAGVSKPPLPPIHVLLAAWLVVTRNKPNTLTSAKTVSGCGAFLRLSDGDVCPFVEKMMPFIAETFLSFIQLLRLLFVPPSYTAFLFSQQESYIT